MKYKKRLAKRRLDKLPESEKAVFTRPGLVKQKTI